MPRDVERIERIGQALEGAGLEALVCSLPANVLMLTGYWPVVGASIAIASRDGYIGVLAPEDEKELAEEAGASETRTFQGGSLDAIRTTADAVREPLIAMLRSAGLEGAVAGCDAGEAYEPASYASMHLYGLALVELLSEALGRGTVSQGGELLAGLRAVKTPIELDRIRRACRIAAIAFEEGTGALCAGLRETEAAALFRTPLYTRGTGYEGVERAGGFVYCMSGPDSGQAYGAYARSRARQLRPGDLVLTHCNSCAGGYWTDITRTYSLGAPDGRRAAMYEAIFAARAAALHAIRPGASACEIDAAARGALAARGFGGAFKHPAGHGVGFAAIDHDARPRLHPKSKERLEAGMVFNVEPGVYFEDGGMRHCDMVAVTENGAELLTPFLCDIEELIR
jgi:Xaa-Pro aminopeptidase